MGNKHNLLTAVSLLALGGTAQAADMVAPEVSNWTGFYVGAGGGGNYLFSSLAVDDYNIDTDTIKAKYSDDAGVARAFGTIELGADYQFDSNFLIGAVGNFDFGGGTDLGSFLTMSDTVADWEVGNSWGIGARAGFLASPRTLIYGVGGFTQLEVSTDLVADMGAGAATSDEEWTSGYFVGAGIETLLTDNLSAKLEYRFSRYNDVSATSDTFSTMGDDHEYQSSTGDIDSHAVRATLAWRFSL